MNAFSRLCRCKFCGKNMKYKVEKGKGKYICSTYDNYGKSKCVRTMVTEEFLLDLLSRRLQRVVLNEEVKRIVDYVEVEDSLLLEIHFKNGSDPILLKRNFVQY